MTAAPLPDVERLRLLRQVDRSSHWYSLEDKRVCALCDRLFSGREIRFLPQEQGGYELRCPTGDCPSTFKHWQVWSGREASPTASSDPGEYRFL